MDAYGFVIMVIAVAIAYKVGVLRGCYITERQTQQDVMRWQAKQRKKEEAH